MDAFLKGSRGPATARPLLSPLARRPALPADGLATEATRPGGVVQAVVRVPKQETDEDVVGKHVAAVGVEEAEGAPIVAQEATPVAEIVDGGVASGR